MQNPGHGGACKRHPDSKTAQPVNQCDAQQDTADSLHAHCIGCCSLLLSYSSLLAAEGSTGKNNMFSCDAYLANNTRPAAHARQVLSMPKGLMFHETAGVRAQRESLEIACQCPLRWAARSPTSPLWLAPSLSNSFRFSAGFQLPPCFFSLPDEQTPLEELGISEVGGRCGWQLKQDGLAEQRQSSAFWGRTPRSLFPVVNIG